MIILSRKLSLVLLLCAFIGVTTSYQNEENMAPQPLFPLEEEPSLGTEAGAAEATGTEAESVPGEAIGTEAAGPTGTEAGAGTGEAIGTETGGETGEAIGTGTETGEAIGTGTVDGTGAGTEVPTLEPIGTETSAATEAAAVVNTEFTVGEDADWLFTLAIENPPEDQTTVQFKEGVEAAVGLGGETTSFLFKEGTLQQDGMLAIPVYVKDHEGPKMITFMVSLDGKDTQVTVNLKGIEPLFSIQQNPIKATEASQWTFILKIQAKTELSYMFKEGDEEVGPEQNTTTFKFGSLVHKAEGNLDEIEVTVRDLSKNEQKFDVTSGDVTQAVTVSIDPPAKPLLLKDKFSVGKEDDYSFTLEIKAKSMPDVSFTEGDAKAKTGENTTHFTFGTMTQDEENLYEIQVKVSEDIDDLTDGSWKFTATIDTEDNEVTVTSEAQSSALRSASVTLACFIWPLVAMLLL